MFKTTKRTMIAALLVAAAILTPSSASARILLDRQAPAEYTQEAGTTVPQIAGVQSSNGFDWADAGIGAAATLVLLGACTGTVVVRRRQVHHPATS